jgi:Predicted membrane protein/domain
MSAPKALEQFNLEDEFPFDDSSMPAGKTDGKPDGQAELKPSVACLLPYAGIPKRAAAWLIDGMLVISASIGTAAILGILLGLTVYPLCPDVSLASAIATYTGYAVGLSVYVLYYLCFECSHLQATPGKLLFALKITDLKGNKITPGRSLYRLVGKFLSGFLFCFGFFLCGITERKQTLHDILAHTLVLHTVPDEKRQR